MSLLARVWPNGEFAIAVRRKAKVRAAKKSDSTGVSMGYSWTPNECGSWDEWRSHYAGGRDAIERLAPGYLDTAVGEVAALGLSDVAKKSKRAKRGSSGLTGYARKMLRNCSWLLAKRCQKYDLGMITLTLPPMLPEDDLRAVNAWGAIMFDFTRWLNRKLKAAGHCPWVVGCCEIQEGRQQIYGGLPLHAHLLVQTRAAKRFLFSPSDIQSKWKETVLRVANIDCAYNWEASTRVETVKKNAENYLAKYISKGVSNPGKLLEENGYIAPSNWWYAVGEIKRYVKKMVRYLSPDDAAFLQWMWRNADYALRYKYDVVVNPDRTNVPVAWIGRLNQKGWNMLRSVWYASSVPSAPTNAASLV